MFINRYLQIRRIICAGLKGEKKKETGVSSGFSVC